MSIKSFGNFTTGLYAVADSRLRFSLLLSLIILVYFVAHFARIFAPHDLSTGFTQQDYAAFYGAAQFAVASGEDNLYTPAVFHEAIGAETDLLWLYPPPMLILLAPLALAPYALVKAIFVFTTIACAFAIGRLSSGASVWGALAILSPAAFSTLYVGQISAIFALFLAAGLLLSEKRPLLAGACIALLTIKAQYGLLVIPFLVATRAWRTLAAASIFTVLMIGASILIYGVDMWQDFFHSLTDGVHAAYYQSGGHSGRITITDAIKGTGFSPPPAWIIYPPLIVAAIAGIFILAKRASRPMLIAYTLAASALVCPYLFVYDFFVYIAAILIVASHCASLKPQYAYLLAALWFAPLAPFIVGSSVTPAIVWPVTALGVISLYRLGFERRLMYTDR